MIRLGSMRLGVVHLDVAALDNPKPVVGGVFPTGQKDVERVSVKTCWLTLVEHVDLEPTLLRRRGKRRVLGLVRALEPGVRDAFDLGKYIRIFAGDGPFHV